uniref:Putative secreted protein n=2 Tax=Anopheles marajoara TaxID=58244 RepID=A0A2M4CBY1_9DIPT
MGRCRWVCMRVIVALCVVVLKADLPLSYPTPGGCPTQSFNRPGKKKILSRILCVLGMRGVCYCRDIRVIYMFSMTICY